MISLEEKKNVTQFLNNQYDTVLSPEMLNFHFPISR